MTFARTHGKSKTPEFAAWMNMIDRCRNPRARAYPSYGGRGIRVCRRWRASFEAFLADVGPRPSEKHSIDRHPDNDGDYEPSNVRWATDVEQSINRRSTRFIEFQGERLSLSDWARRLGLTRQSMRFRIAKWGVERALTAPRSEEHVHVRS